jgi:hypothetical protein
MISTELSKTLSSLMISTELSKNEFFYHFLEESRELA